MAIDREKIYVGLVSKNGFFSFEYPRKIIFSYEKHEGIGYDIINNITYPLNNPSKRKAYYISNIISLNSILQQLEYRETLEVIDIERIMNEDFEKIFIESGIMNHLYSSSMETFSPILQNKYLDILKDEFKMNMEEQKNSEDIKIKSNYQKQKRRF